MEKGLGIIVPLNESNYPTWKLQVKMLLIKEGLYGFVDGSESAPADTSRLANYNSRKNKALANIVLAIDPKLLYLISDPDDPATVWNKLRDTFQKKSWSNKLRLRKKLYSMRLENNGNLQEYLKTCVELFDEMAVIGDALSEEDKVISLLASLPDSYSVLVTALQAQDSVPSWEAVQERLLHENAKRTEGAASTGASHNGDGSALFSGNFKKDFQHKGKKSIKCFHCGLQGHFKRDCRALKSQLSKSNFSGNNKPSKSQNVSVAQSRPTGNTPRPNDSEVTLLASALGLSSVSRVEKNSFIIDSGATQHMCCTKENMVDYQVLDNPILVQIGDGRELKGIGTGCIHIKTSLPDNKIINCILEDVLHVPELSFNLISVAKASAKGRRVVFTDETCKIFSVSNSLIGIGKKVNKLYFLECEVNFAYICRPKSSNVKDSYLWHQRFCHLGYDNLKKLVVQDMVHGLKCDFSCNFDVCEHCCNGKNMRKPFPSINTKRDTVPLELIHSDVCGKLNPKSLGGAEYFVSFIDDSSRYCWIYMLKCKSEVFKVFKEFKTLVENQYNAKIKRFRSDNGGEFCSNEFENFFRENGIKHEKTVPKSPQQNGISERLNRTLIEKVRTMLSDAALPKSFWAEALNTAAYVHNRSPTASLNKVTPYEALIGRKPSVSHFRTFGSICYSHVPKDERGKLDSKSRKCLFVGYGQFSKGYRVYDIENKKTIISRDVIFDESNRLSVQKESCPDNSNYLIGVGSASPESVESDSEITEFVESDSELSDIEPEQLRRSDRVNKQPDRYGEWVYSCAVNADPASYEEAVKCLDKDKWIQAMNKEINSIAENKVWTLTELPNDIKPVNCKWVYKTKRDGEGNVESYKARLVAQGYSQIEGIDYDQTFAPVARFESIRTLLSLAVQYDLKLHQMDVQNAFLNGKLEENIFIRQPKGFIVSGKENCYCKLNKSLYGLKQSSRCWNSELNAYLVKLGFIQSVSDPCIYTRVSDELCIIAVYVDDLIIGSKSIDEINAIKQSLCDQYKMKDLGVLNHFLGVKVEQSVKNNSVFINQSAFASLLVSKFNFENSRSVKTPSDVNVKPEDNELSEPFDSKVYQSCVGGLLYLSNRTRPDLTYSVSKAARYCSNPTKEHWSFVKRILRYLNGTLDHGIVYSKVNEPNLVGYSDADWAGDVKDRKSTSGYCFKYCNGIISWRSSKQNCVALSTAEAEYVALSSATQEAVWLNQLLHDVNFSNSDSPVTLFEDNQATIAIAKNPQSHPKTKHIGIKYHYIRDLVSKNVIALEYCPTDMMLADIFTKSLSPDKFVKLREMLGMMSSSDFRAM